MKKIITGLMVLLLILFSGCTGEALDKISDTTISQADTEENNVTSETSTETKQSEQIQTASQTESSSIIKTTKKPQKTTTATPITTSAAVTQSEQTTRKQLNPEPENCFDVKIYTDKTTYTTTEPINCWATVEYIGNNDSITICHASKYLIFSITDGKDFNAYGFTDLVGVISVINKGVVMRQDYDGTVGFDKNDPDSEFWEEANKHLGKVLMLPAGDYTIKANMNYSLVENNIMQTEHTQFSEVKITVE